MKYYKHKQVKITELELHISIQNNSHKNIKKKVAEGHFH